MFDMKNNTAARTRGETSPQSQGYIATLDVGPVFRGLADAGMSGRQVAQMLGVAPSTVSKWRRGNVPAPGDAVQFLTLILADLIRDKERTLDAMNDAPLAWRLGRESELAAMRQSLARQEALNATLTAPAVRDGARLFKNWLDKARQHDALVRPQRVRLTA